MQQHSVYEDVRGGETPPYLFGWASASLPDWPVQMTSTDVEGQIILILEDMIQDWGLEERVTGTSFLVADLEFESIDVIQMVVSIEQHFGNRNLRFDELLMQNGRYVSDLSVQDIAEFVSGKL